MCVTSPRVCGVERVAMDATPVLPFLCGCGMVFDGGSRVRRESWVGKDNQPVARLLCVGWLLGFGGGESDGEDRVSMTFRSIDSTHTVPDD